MKNTILPRLTGCTATSLQSLQAIEHRCFQHVYEHNLWVNERNAPYSTNLLYISNRRIKLIALKLCNVTRDKN